MFLVEHVLTLIKQFKDKKKKVRSTMSIYYLSDVIRSRPQTRLLAEHVQSI